MLSIQYDLGIIVEVILSCRLIPNLLQVNRALEGHFNRIDAAFEERLCRVEQNTDRTTLTAVQSVSSKLLQEVQDVVNQNSEQFLDKVLQNLSAQISQNVITSVKSEMREQQTVMHETIQALRSGIATPGGAAANQVQQQQKPQQTMQDIKSALAKKDYNTAFRTALSASDLAVVLYVCEKATVKEVRCVVVCYLVSHSFAKRCHSFRKLLYGLFLAGSFRFSGDQVGDADSHHTCGISPTN